MIRQVVTFVGRHFLRRAVSSGAGQIAGGALDPKFGLKLLRDKRVPLQPKIAALALGLGAVFVLQILELPFEAALALFLPLLGLATDIALNGAELLAGPLLVATLTLPYLAPREVVEQIRAEAGQTDSQGRVYVTAPIRNSTK